MDDIWEILNIKQIDSKDIEYAFEKVQAFAALNYSREEPERQESIDIVIASLGIDKESMEDIRARLKNFLPEKHTAGLIGVLIGLWMAESATLKENDADNAILG